MAFPNVPCATSCVLFSPFPCTCTVPFARPLKFPQPAVQYLALVKTTVPIDYSLIFFGQNISALRSLCLSQNYLLKRDRYYSLWSCFQSVRIFSRERSSSRLLKWQYHFLLRLCKRNTIYVLTRFLASAF
jgi:hypothetical protein